ncbi:MAG: shikimate dehydrogenase [Pirellulaceae bacterium]|nr:shikimate dehydrogenase [Pirellulaceae bacterium]
MICVSIGRGRHKQMIAEYRHLVEQGAKLIELRLDYIRRDVNLKRLLADRLCPIVVSCRREQDGGRWAGTEAARMILLRSAIADGVDYIDLEEDVAGSVPRFGVTKRIISYHNFRETPEDLAAIHQRCVAQDPDIVKIATMANHPHDSVRMMELIRASRVPTVGLCMGEVGTASRLLAGKFGAPFSYATFHHERALAPGQLSYRQMCDIYHYDEVRADTEIYGVVADPVGHSLSPVVHNSGFRQMGLNKAYVPFRVSREQLAPFLQDCPALDVRGLSVTIPHKEQVVKLLTRVDPAVAAIGAANTVIFGPDGTMGYNTDWQAAMESLATAHGPDEESESFAGRVALVLGSGGVSRAIAYGLLQQGAEVVISGRSANRSATLATEMGCRHVEWSARHNVKAHAIINGTPVGMHPNVDESPYDGRYIRRHMIVFDTVYNPEQTLLIKQAREQGCRLTTGVEMFVRQAALQFKLFTGHEAPLDTMRQTVRRVIGAARSA